MRSRLISGLVCAIYVLSLARAQTTTPPVATGSVFGSVSGHVYCADTNEPARLATVTLQLPAQKSDVPTGKRISPGAQSVPPATRTGLDGSFLFPKVQPGTYVIVAEYAGYVSPIATLSQEEIRSKAPADIDKVEKVLTKVIVAANKDSARDLELERGAAIAGTVRYDDGSPANEIQVALLRLGSDGKHSAVSLNISGQIRSAFHVRGEGLEANDLGHYRISGLPAGKYILKTTLPTLISSYGGFFGGPILASMRTDDSGALSVYSGNVFREKDARPIEVVAGSERDGVDITIPLLGLRSISGSVIALYDGHAINNGLIRLLYADDKSEARHFPIQEDGSFNLRFVPDGEYILRITHAADVVDEEGIDPQDGLSYNMGKIAHSYASVDLPISVHSDLSNLTINAPDKPASTVQKQ